MHNSYAGHYAIDLKPAMYNTLVESLAYHEADADIPKPLRPKEHKTPPRRQTFQTNKVGKARFAKILATICMLTNKITGGDCLKHANGSSVCLTPYTGVRW